MAAATSLAFVVAAAAVVLLARRRRRAGEVARVGAYATLVAAVGLGSVIDHGPAPAWSDVAHDWPLVALLLFVAADAVADLTDRPRAWWWWAPPSAALVPVVVVAPVAGDRAQACVAGVAVVLTLVRAWRRPAQRRRVAWALGLLAGGAAVGTLSRAGGVLCVAGVWQGHAAWHVLAAGALVVLAPTVGTRPGVRA